MKTASLLFALIALQACDFSQRIDTAAAVKEMKSRQVKRVLPQDIVNQVDMWGQESQSKGATKLDSATKALSISVRVGAPANLKSTFQDAKMVEIMDALDYSLGQKQDILFYLQNLMILSLLEHGQKSMQKKYDKLRHPDDRKADL